MLPHLPPWGINRFPSPALGSTGTNEHFAAAVISTTSPAVLPAPRRTPGQAPGGRVSRSGGRPEEGAAAAALCPGAAGRGERGGARGRGRGGAEEGVGERRGSAPVAPRELTVRGNSPLLRPCRAPGNRGVRARRAAGGCRRRRSPPPPGPASPSPPRTRRLACPGVKYGMQRWFLPRSQPSPCPRVFPSPSCTACAWRRGEYPRRRRGRRGGRSWAPGGSAHSLPLCLVVSPGRQGRAKKRRNCGRRISPAS